MRRKVDGQGWNPVFPCLRSFVWPVFRAFPGFERGSAPDVRSCWNV